MTPDKARELLENAAPGRWEYKDYTVYTNAGRDVLTIPDGVYGMIQEQDGPLVAAARDLAELVAGLRYEYAVQVPVNGHWEYTKDDQYGPEVLRNPRDATWYSSRHAAKTWADLWDDGEESPRIVRRLVSEEEVVS